MKYKKETINPTDNKKKMEKRAREVDDINTQEFTSNDNNHRCPNISL